MDSIRLQLMEYLPSLSFLIVYVLLFVFAKIIYKLQAPYNVDDELTTKDNAALAVSLSGYFCAFTIIFIGTLLGPTQGLQTDLVHLGAYALLGVILLHLSYWINDKVLLYQFSNRKEIIEDKNVGTAAVQFASYVSSGLIIAGALNGQGGSILTALAFFALGQCVLILFSYIYNFITPYCIHDEIEKDNVAAGLGFGGALLGLGIILMKGVSGDFISWIFNFQKFWMYAVLIIIFLVGIRLFFDKVVLLKSDLNHEIKNDRNIGAGWLEAVCSVCFSVILFYVF